MYSMDTVTRRRWSLLPNLLFRVLIRSHDNLHSDVFICSQLVYKAIISEGCDSVGILVYLLDMLWV